ncbi:hypothetical protein Tco_1490527 [Tanacetum coccineum]
MSSDLSQKLKGSQTLTPKEQIAADTMKALKESKKTSTRQPCTRGISEGTCVSLGVPNESIVVPATSSKGTNTKPGVPDEEKVKKTFEETDDEFVHGKEHVQDNDDELVHCDEQVNDDEDEEMTNAKVEESRNGDKEITDAAKVDAEKTEEVKDDAKKAELPLISSSLLVSSVIFEPSVLTPIPETPLVAPATTLLLPPSVSTIPPVLLQTTTPIPTLLITTKAPTITIVVLESNALTILQVRVASLEKDVSELKKIDHSAKALASLKS